ncbi:hypothetical protein IV203_009746 [Nitzschia inconspicua]|uniref:Uncharacterized protein n=1 Tax=Nitzschia inconspicua TaxID=303405 RepID=A0A9K3KW67_9STRA|nr:hypothetical protein IV203_009746 [Nitzschia inconspicua]
MSSILLRSAASASRRHLGRGGFGGGFFVVPESSSSVVRVVSVAIPSSSSSCCYYSSSSPVLLSSPSSGSGSPSENSSSSGGISGWMKRRAERKEQKRYMEQMERLSNMDVFTMENYREELKRGLSGFAANISFMQSKEIKMAKEVVQVVDTFIEVLGPNATAEDLIEMDRLQRLKVATAANKTLEEIAILVSQITNMDVMQKALRKRRLEGKPIPKDQDAMQAAIKKDAMQVLSKSQMELLRSRQEDAARRMARRRRK